MSGTMNYEASGEEDEWLQLGITSMVKGMALLEPEVYEDLKYIFDTSQGFDLDDSSIDDYRYVRKLDNYEKQFEMPRCLPKGVEFGGDNLIVLLESRVYNNVMVFVITNNTDKVSLFHVLTKKFGDDPHSGSVGYAAIGERLYFVGGSFRDHCILGCADLIVQRRIQEMGLLNQDENFNENRLMEEVVQELRNSEPKHLNVPTFNLITRDWEDHTPHLNGPKPTPVVFVYDQKIFAITGKHFHLLHPEPPPVEVLDTNSNSSWNLLPPPPLDMNSYSHHILDDKNGMFYMFFSTRGWRSVTKPCCALNLKETSPQWIHNTFISPENPQEVLMFEKNLISPFSQVGRTMMCLSREDCLGGCIVDNIFFCFRYDHEIRKPIIRGHHLDLAEIESEPWVIDLEEVFKEKCYAAGSYGFLNHISNLRFCLVLNYITGSQPLTNALYSLTFDLVKDYIGLGHKKKKYSTPFKKKRFNFSVKHVCDGVFQLPSGFLLQFCKKLKL